MPPSPRRPKRQDREAASCRDRSEDAATTSVPDDHSAKGCHVTRTVGILPDDLYDYYGPQLEPRRGPAPAAGGKVWRVTDDWPERVPVTEAEIEVFERWFADLFDELFGPTGR